MNTPNDPYEDEPREPPNHRAQEKIVMALWGLLDACAAWFAVPDAEGHEGKECDCDFCRDARALYHLAEMFEGTMSCLLLSFPEASARLYRELAARADTHPVALKLLADHAGAAAIAGTEADGPPPAVAADPPAAIKFRPWL